MKRICAYVVLLAAGLISVFPATAHQCSHHRSDACTGCSADCYSGCNHYGVAARQGAIRAAEDTREGKVSEVIYLPGRTRDAAMVQIKLAAGTDQILIRLGPVGFLSNNDVNVREGDSIRVDGYWVTTAEGDLLVAMQLTRNGKTVRLRSDFGRSAW